MATTVDDLFTIYKCTNCQDELKGIRVKCAVCEDIELCLQCFAAGAELGAHQNNHAYMFRDTGTQVLSIFRGKNAWTAVESIRLLDAVEQYGYGNWEDVSRYIETKSPDDAKEEYVNKWINGTIGRRIWAPAQEQRPELADSTANEAETPVVPLDITAEEAAQIGYMPNRDGFERECLPLAERGISSMGYSTEDSEHELKLKLALVDAYTRRLRERERRKRVMREHQISARFFRETATTGTTTGQQQGDLTKELKEFRDRFRVFAQFYKSSDYEQIIPALSREKDLRLRLAELCRYRQHGIKKVADCQHFEQHAAVASQCNAGLGASGSGVSDSNGGVKTDNSPNCHGDQLQHTSAGHNQVPPVKQIKIELLSDVDESRTSHGQKRMHHTADQSCYAGLSHSKSYTDNGGSQHHHQKRKTSTASSNSINTSHNNTNSNQVTKCDIIKDEFSSSKLAKPNEPNALSVMKSSVARKQIDALRKLELPIGTELLNTRETLLCKNFEITPTEYFAHKTAILGGAPLPVNASEKEKAMRTYFAQWLNC